MAQALQMNPVTSSTLARNERINTYVAATINAANRVIQEMEARGVSAETRQRLMQVMANIHAFKGQLAQALVRYDQVEAAKWAWRLFGQYLVLSEISKEVGMEMAFETTGMPSPNQMREALRRILESGKKAGKYLKYAAIGIVSLLGAGLVFKVVTQGRKATAGLGAGEEE